MAHPPKTPTKRMQGLIPHLIGHAYGQGHLHGSFEAETLFIDISGFTALTSALMRYEKDGAEALTIALNEVFEPLVQIIYQHGGVISTFAGDAFTALFPSHQQNTTPHALNAAFLIQQFFRERHEELITPYGSFTVGVKQGLGHGQVQWSILSTSEETSMATYVFEGEAIEQCARAEHAAERGDIIAHPSIMSGIQTLVETIPVETCFRVMNLRHRAPPLPRAPLAADDSRLPVLSDDPLLRHFGLERVRDFVQSGVKGEFRTIAVVFLSFAGSAVSNAWHPFVETVLHLTQTYGGYFNKLDTGDKGHVMLILFGAPVSHENDPERAASFLLDLRARPTEVPWRAGLTFGMVYAGLMGGMERQEYTAIGDVVNLAARLMMQAPWGEVWTHAYLARLLRLQSYHLRPVGALSFKGIATKTNVEHLLSKSSEGETRSLHRPLVGRDAELRQLDAWTAPIFQQHTARVIVIYGEAGIGKSHLLHALRQRFATLLHTPFTWFVCASESLVPQSLGPFRALFRRYFEQSDEHTDDENKQYFTHILEGLRADLQEAHTETWLGIAQELERTHSFLGALLDLFWEGSLYAQLDPDLRFQNTLQAITTLLQAECLRQPVVMQVENLHELDDDSLGLLASLSRTMQPYPFAMIGTSRYRDDGSRVDLHLDAGVVQHTLALQGLPEADGRALIAHVLSGNITDELATFGLEKSAGNPFFLEQMVLDLLEQGSLIWHQDRGWSLVNTEIVHVPRTITAVLIARLDRLDTAVRQVVQTAAVLGREFSARVLQVMLPNEPRLDERITAAERSSIWSLINERSYLFRHALMREAAYDMQLRRRLRELHTLAAAALEQIYADYLTPYYADLTYHYGKAEITEHERVYARLAGEQAATRFANAEAVAYLSRALSLTPEEETNERYALLLAREQVFDRQGNREAQERDLHTLESLVQTMEAEKQAEVALRWSRYAIATDDYTNATQAARRAIALAQPIQMDQAIAQGHLFWGQSLICQSEYEEARSILDHALDLARSLGWRTIEAETLRQLGIAVYYQGDYATARSFDEQALQLFRAIGDRLGEAKSLDSLGSNTHHDYAHSASYYHHAMALYHEIGFRWGEAQALGNLGILNREQGYYEQAIINYDQVLTISRSIGSQYVVGWILGNLGLLYLDLGAYQKASHCFEQSLEICQSIGSRGDEGWILACLSLWSYLTGKHAVAYTYSQQALHIAGELGDSSIEGDALLNMGHIFTDLDLLEQALSTYRVSLEVWQQIGQNNRAMEAQAGLASIFLSQGDLPQAHHAVEEILRFLETESLDGADQPFRVYLTCVQVLQALQDSRAEPILNEALVLLRERADHIEDDRLRCSYLEEVAVHRELLAMQNNATMQSR